LFANSALVDARNSLAFMFVSPWLNLIVFSAFILSFYSRRSFGSTYGAILAGNKLCAQG
jgi:hypothetical protein